MGDVCGGILNNKQRHLLDFNWLCTWYSNKASAFMDEIIFHTEKFDTFFSVTFDTETEEFVFINFEIKIIPCHGCPCHAMRERDYSFSHISFWHNCVIRISTSISFTSFVRVTLHKKTRWHLNLDVSFAYLHSMWLQSLKVFPWMLTYGNWRLLFIDQ